MQLSKFITAALFLCLLSSIYQSQTYYSPGYNDGRIRKELPANSAPQYSIEAYIDYGYTPADGSSPTKINRSVWEFEVPKNLPEGAYFTNIELKYRTQASAGMFSVMYLPVTSFDSRASAEEKWNAMGTCIFVANLGPKSDVFTAPLPALQDYANKAYEQKYNKIYLEFRAASETSSNPQSELYELELIFHYSIYTRHTITHNYGDNIEIKINNEAFYPRPSGYLLMTGMNNTVTLKARTSYISNGQEYIWNQDPNTVMASRSTWVISPRGFSESYSNEPVVQYTTNTNTIYTTCRANAKKLHPVNFNTAITSSALQVPITINGISYNNSSPVFKKVEYNSISVSVPSVIAGENNITYYFDKWLKNNASYSPDPTATFIVDEKATYTAKYLGYADGAIYPHITSSSGDNTKITFSWNEYPNTSVTQYQIIRRAEQNKGGEDITNVIATVPRGTTSYTDLYYRLNSSGDYNLFYEVHPYYSPDATYAHAIPVTNMFAFVGSKTGYGDGEILNKNFIKTKEYINCLSSYPNPFNPSTRISYSIKNSGLVNITIFDILGNRVSELVNNYSEPGEYEVVFNGQDLPSGYYICRIKSGEFTDSKKLLLMK